RLPELEILPAEVVLRAFDSSAHEINFSVRLSQVGGPPFDPSIHRIDLTLAPPWHLADVHWHWSRDSLPADVDFTLAFGDGLIESCQSFVDRLATRRIDWVAAVVGFGDLTVEGDRIVATPFSSSAERVKSLLRGLPRYSGGGNEGESSLEALSAALAQPGYRADAMKVVVLITDEPALQRKLRPATMS